MPFDISKIFHILNRCFSDTAKYYGLISQKCPRIVNLMLTPKCNLRCRMCNVWRDRNKIERKLTDERFKSLLKELSGYGAKIIHFTGGEPMLHSSLYGLLSLAKQLGLETWLVTNGLLLRKQYSKILSHLDKIAISVDAPDADAHDRNRGVAGTFNMVLDGVRKLVAEKRRTRSKIEIHFNVTITPETIHNPKHMISLGRSLGIDAITYNPVTSGEFSYTNLKNPFDFEDRTATNLYLEMIEEIINIIPDSERLIRVNPMYMTWVEEEIKGKHRRLPCRVAARSQCFISPDGEVLPCCIWNKSMGNIENKKFSEVWEGPRAQGIRKLIKRHRCPDCYNSVRSDDALFSIPLLLRSKNIYTILRTLI